MLSGVVNVPQWYATEGGGASLNRFGYDGHMGQGAILGRTQAFAVRDRAQMRRALVRRRWLTALVIPLAFTSCVGRLPDTPSLATAPVVSRQLQSGAATLRGARSLVAGVSQQDRMRATLCLASAIYYEAATESDDGQRAVAQVVLNRVRHGREWANTVCGVVYQGSNQAGCQFSFACDGAMARTPSLTAWIRARRVAEAALAGDVYAPVGSATFYHTTAVAPGWRTRMIPVDVVGAHIFYRLPGDAADAASLPVVYRGGEPSPGPLPSFAMAVDARSRVVPVAMVPVVVAPVAKPLTHEAANALPDSDIRPEWRDSGMWIAGR